MDAERSRDVREGGVWSTRQRRKNDLVLVLVRGALAVARAMPRVVVAWACALVALAAYACVGDARRGARARLSRGLARPVREPEIVRAFLGVGSVLADTVALLDPRDDARRTLVMDDDARAVFRDALAEGRGVVYVTAHLGPWERMAAVLAAEGFPVAAVARESYDPRLTRLYDELRAPRGVRAIYRGRPGAVARTLRELSAGRAVGFLVDLPARVPSLDVTLFGRVTPMPIGPARIAIARRAAVIVGTPEPCEPGSSSYRLRLRRIDTADLGRDHDAAAELCRRLARELDARIAIAPWTWLGVLAPVMRSTATRSRQGGRARYAAERTASRGALHDEKA
jgi:KDO2-lipid IV(A) lauroyltransferase